ncbi:MAG: thermonuclease family protein [bacterium]|nr:thermonuclease family protein [bacterium]
MSTSKKRRQTKNKKSQQSKSKKSQNKWSKIIIVLSSALVFFLAFIFLVAGYKASGLLMAILGLLIIPSIWQSVIKATNLKIDPSLRIVVLVLLFFVAIAVTPETAPSQTTEVDLEPETVAESQEKIVENENIIAAEAVTDKPDQEIAIVKRVIDGDTIELEDGRKLRYIGIDSPEINDAECYAQEAKNKNSDLVLGKTVTLEKDVSETDRYGRLLRYVYLDGEMINELLVEKGYAKASSYPPDIKHQEKLTQAQKVARQNKNGLWGVACETVAKASPASTPVPVVATAVPVPVAVVKTTPQPVTTVKATPQPVTQKVAATTTQNSESYSCNCSKVCEDMSSCAEAQYQLNVCGCSKRDGDHDGIACDKQCQ